MKSPIRKYFIFVVVISITSFSAIMGYEITEITYEKQTNQKLIISAEAATAAIKHEYEYVSLLKH